MKHPIISIVALLIPMLTSTAMAQSVGYACKVENVKKSSDMLEFTIVLTDYEDGYYQNALMVGNQGTDNLRIITQTKQQFVLLEKTDYGNAMLTTIMRSTGEAVHSRHFTSTLIKGEGSMLPSQYVGSCKKRL